MGDIMVDASGVLGMLKKCSNKVWKKICSWQRMMEEYGSKQVEH